MAALKNNLKLVLRPQFTGAKGGSVLEQPEVAELIAVNDASSDGTGEVLLRLSCELPKLRAFGTLSE